MKQLITYFFIAIVGFSCQKIVDMPITNGPQFNAIGVLVSDPNGLATVDSLNVTAGDNGCYYNSYQENRNGVMVYVGEFIFGNGSKKLKFEQYDQSIPYNVNQSGTLLNEFSKYSKFSSAYSAYLFFDSSAVHGANIVSSEWHMNGMVYNDNFHLINEPGVYDVKLKFDFGNGQISTLNNRVYLGFDNPCWGYFNITNQGNGEFNFVSQVQNSATSIKWIVDDSLTFQQNELSIQLDSGLHKVVMLVTDNLGHLYSRERNVGYGVDNFVGEFGFLKSNSGNLYNSMIVTYEENGVIYTSKLLNQDNSILEAGEESKIMETASDLVLKYPVNMSLKLINTTDFSDLKELNLSGNLGFQVNK